MKPRTLLVLTLLVATLAAFIWFFERELPSSEERAELADRVLPMEPDEVAAVAIEWNGRSVRLERRGGESGEEEDAPAPPPEWRLVEPYDARADEATVDTLLEALTGLRKTRTLEDFDPSAVGLEAPRGSVTLTTSDGETLLRVGAGVPASDNVIVALQGATDAWVTSGSFLAQLDREAEAWRSRDVVAVAREDVREIRLSGSREADTAGPVVLERRGERFYLAEPIEDLASADLVDRLLADIATLRARRFLDDDPRSDAELGLDPPRGTIEVTLEDGGTVRVELGAPVDGEARPSEAAPRGDPEAVYARVDGQRFETATDLLGALDRPASEWRSPAWSAFRSFEVDRIDVVEPGEGDLALARSGVDWRRVSGSSDETIPYTAASDLLFALTEAEGELAQIEAPGEPILTVRLRSVEDGEKGGGEGGEETLVLYGEIEAAGDGDGAVHPARSSARSSTLLLPAADVAEVLEAIAAVRAAEPAPADEGGE